MTAVKPVRLGVNLAADVARALRRWSAYHDVSITEGARRAIAVWNFVEQEQAQGNRVAIIEGWGDAERVREVTFFKT